MADNFNDKNLFGDSFDLFQSNSDNLFGGSGASKAVGANSKTSNNLQSQKASSPKVDFGFDDNNLFGETSLPQNKNAVANNLFDSSLNDDLFGTNDLNKNTSFQTNQNSQVQTQKNTLESTNFDFGFDNNNLFGETSLPKSEQKPKVESNLFDSADDLFGRQDDSQIDAGQNEIEEQSQEVQEELQEEVEVQEELQEAESLTDVTTEETLDEPKSKKSKGKSGKNKKSKNKKDAQENIEQSETIEDNFEEETIDEEEIEQEETIEEEISDEEQEENQEGLQEAGEEEQKIEAQESEKKSSKIKELFKNKKFLIILASVVLAIVVGVILIVAFSGKPGEKRLTPTFEVYQRDSGTILVVEEQDNALGYEVVISQTGKQDAVFASQSNTIELRLYLNEPGIFNVKIRVLGESATTHSDFSASKQVVNYVKLDTPLLFKDENIISWDNVKNAVAYKLYYRANVQDGVVDFIEIPADKSEYTFDLTQLNSYGAGLYPITVEAIASGEFMLNSDYSQAINYAYCAKIDMPMAVVFDSNTNKLNFVVEANKTKASKYMVVASLQNGAVLAEHIVFADELQKQETDYQGNACFMYTADLTEMLSGQPVNITIKALGDGIYTYDSDLANALTI